jgi:hypothetical protein
MRRGVFLLIMFCAAALLLLLLGSEDGDRKAPLFEGHHSPTGSAGPCADAKSDTLTAFVSGTVTKRGKPVAATVSVRTLPAGEVIAKGRAGDDGRFELTCPPTTDCEVRATVKDGSWGSTQFKAGAPGVRVPRNVVIADGPLTLIGSVRWEDGAPFEGDVVVRNRRVPLDGAGRFSLPGLHPGLIQVRARSADLEFPPRPVWLPEEGPLDIVLDEGWLTIGGKIVSAANDEPVRGAELSADCGDWCHPALVVRGRTNAAGSFRLRLPVDRGGMKITARGFAPREFPLQGRTGEFVIRLLPTGSVSGVVQTPDGTPLKGIPVLAVPLSRWFWDAVATVSDAQGRYFLTDLPAEDLNIFAYGSGHCTHMVHPAAHAGECRIVTQVEPGQEVVSDLPVVPSSSISGRVLDAEGAGVPGAAVKLFQSPDEVTFGYHLDPHLVVATDREGCFRFETVWPGLTCTLVAKQGSRHHEVGCGPLQSGERAEVEIRLQAVRLIDVRLLDRDSGEPVVGADVRIGRASGRYLEPEGQGSGWTDVLGHVRVPVTAEDPIVVWTRHRDFFRAGLIPVEGEFVRIPLEKGKTIEGRVFLPDESCADVASVSAFPMKSTMGFQKSWLGVSCGPTGFFRVSGLSDGEYDFKARGRAQGRWHTGQSTASAGARDVEIRVTEAEPELPDDSGTESVFVRVVGPNGALVMSGHARLTTVGGIRSNNHGFELTGREVPRNSSAGPRFVEVYRARDFRGRLLGAALAGPFPPEGEVIEIRLTEPHQIRGMVLDASGKGVHGVMVAAAPTSSASSGIETGSHAVTWTNRDGSFTLNGLGDLHYLVRFNPPPGFRATPSIESRPGADRLTVTLRAPSIR